MCVISKRTGLTLSYQDITNTHLGNFFYINCKIMSFLKLSQAENRKWGMWWSYSMDLNDQNKLIFLVPHHNPFMLKSSCKNTSNHTLNKYFKQPNTSALLISIINCLYKRAGVFNQTAKQWALIHRFRFTTVNICFEFYFPIMLFYKD